MADNFSGWPTVTDDDGSLTVGTPFSNAYDAAVRAALADNVYSSTNPTVKTKTIIDEVVAARGSLGSLDTRLDVALNEDGTLKSIAGLVTTSDFASVLHGGNWLYNDDFLIWAAGDAVAPTGWVLFGAGTAAARSGTGLADTNTKVGPYSVKLTRAAADGGAAQYLLNNTSFAASGQHLKGTKIGYGCWVKTSLANAARISINDGVTITTSSYHTGNGAWQWLSVVHTISNTATLLAARLETNTSAGDSYFSGPTAVPGNIAPGGWIPCPKSKGAIVAKRAGVLGVVASFDWFWPGLPLIVDHVKLAALTAPTGQPLIADVKSASGTSMFTTKPQIGAGATHGGASPDGTYRHRCFNGGTGSSLTDAYMVFDIAQVGSGVAGADLTIMVRAIQYNRPQQSLLDPADF